MDPNPGYFEAIIASVGTVVAALLGKAGWDRMRMPRNGNGNGHKDRQEEILAALREMNGRMGRIEDNCKDTTDAVKALHIYLAGRMRE